VTNWKKTLLATASGLVLAGAAQAADLPLKGVAPAAIPYSNWTGGYIGAHVGFGSQQSTCRPDFNADAGGACASYAYAYYGNTWTAHDSSAMAGVEIGYDWQHRSFVYGLAADWTWTGLKGRSVGCSGSCSYEAKINWLASFRGRAGLAVEDTLIYMTAGLALGGVKDRVFAGSTGSLPDTTFKETMVGWVGGGGVEHKLNRNWSVKAEYLHYDLGKKTGAVGANGYSYTHEFNHVVDAVRVGANYRW
jgi:outer membrane immunogenic protein